MKSGLWYLRIAVSNVRGPPSVVPFVVMPAVLLSWVVGVMLVAGPEHPLVHYLSLIAGAAGFAAWIGFHVFPNLRSRYPPLVLAGGGLCIHLSGVCLWREPSLGLLLRLSLPLLLIGLLGFYIFYFSVFWGKQRISRLQVGDRFPDFALPDTQNRTVTLASVLSKGPVLMLFYKGDW